MNRHRTSWAAFAAIVVAFLAGPASATEYEADRIVVSLNPGATIEQINASWGTTTLDAFPEGNLYLLDAAGLGDVEALATSMGADPAVQEAEANYLGETPETIRQMVVVIVGGGYSEYADQSIGPRIGHAPAHLLPRGAGITVAVLDTGIDAAHIAFAGRLSPAAYDFVDHDADPSETQNGLDEDQDSIADEGYGHGTMVAGVVALVAPEATILPVRVLNDEGNGDAYGIAKGIRYAVNQGADVINLSFGVMRHLSTIGHQVAWARAQGVVVVAGAGNEGLEQAYYPAGDSDAEMVTAVDSLDIKASFSDWDQKVLVSAPGTGVRSAFPGGVWANGNGCSFATPFVAGEAALIRSLSPADPPDSVRDRIARGVVPIDLLPGNEAYQEKLGSGRISLPLALGASMASVDPISFDLRIKAAPNPSRGEVLLWASESLREHDVRVFDAKGRLVCRLDPADAPVWDGRRADGRPAGPGVYFLRAQHGRQQLVTRVSLLR